MARGCMLHSDMATQISEPVSIAIRDSQTLVLRGERLSRQSLILCSTSRNVLWRSKPTKRRKSLVVSEHRPARSDHSAETAEWLPAVGAGSWDFRSMCRLQSRVARDSVGDGTADTRRTCFRPRRLLHHLGLGTGGVVADRHPRTLTQVPRTHHRLARHLAASHECAATQRSRGR
jgi:hypothetical protein